MMLAIVDFLHVVQEDQRGQDNHVPIFPSFLTVAHHLTELREGLSLE